MTLEFKRVLLSDVPKYEAEGWKVETRDGKVPFTLFSSGHGEETLMRREVEYGLDSLPLA